MSALSAAKTVSIRLPSRYSGTDWGRPCLRAQLGATRAAWAAPETSAYPELDRCEERRTDRRERAEAGTDMYGESDNS